MSNHPYVLFAGVGQLPTCKQCYYTTTEPLSRSILKVSPWQTSILQYTGLAMADRIVG